MINGTVSADKTAFKKVGQVTLPVPIPDEEKNLSEIFIFTLLCGASKGFIKALKAFKKLFEAPQRSAKITISLNFHFNTTFRNARYVKGKLHIDKLVARLPVGI